MKKIIAMLMILIAPNFVSAKTLTICAVAWPPFLIEEKSVFVGGITMEVFSEAFGRLGVDYQIISAPFKRCLESTRSGKFDAVNGISLPKPLLSTGVHPHAFYPIAIYVRKDFPEEYYSPDKLKGKLVGIVRGYENVIKLAESKGWAVHKAKNDANIVQMLKYKRFDYALLDIIATPELSKKFNAPVRFLQPVVNSSKLYLGFSPSNNDIMQGYDKAIGQMILEGVMDEIYKKHLPYSYSELRKQTEPFEK